MSSLFVHPSIGNSNLCYILNRQIDIFIFGMYSQLIMHFQKQHHVSQWPCDLDCDFCAMNGLSVAGSIVFRKHIF